MTVVSEIRKRVKRAMLNVLAIAPCCSTVLASEGIDGADDEVAMIREELELLRSRLCRVPPRRRPYYTPIERMRILELKALRAWNHQEIADRFLVTPATIASWLGRCDEPGDFVKTRVPVNKLADFVRYAAQRLKVFCPRLGKLKIAEILCRAGLDISATSVGRILKERPAPEPDEARAPRPSRRMPKLEPDDVWHVDSRSHSYSHSRLRILASMGPQRGGGELAVLLVGRSCRGRCFPAMPGIRCLSKTAQLRAGSALPRSNHPPGRPRAGDTDLGPRATV